MGHELCVGSRSSSLLPPDQALREGRWVKLILGASNQDLAAIEDLAGVYSLAGVHCIDAAADGAVIAAVARGVAWAQQHGAANPWLMVSLSDGEDPHFRKAWFDPQLCPADCRRPCERVCPALAIGLAATGQPGVLAERCYGCGRCLPACPLGLIEERSQVLDAAAVPALLARWQPQAVELHCQPGRLEAFAARLAQLRASGVALRRVAVSMGPGVGPAVAPQLAQALWQCFGLLRVAGYRPLWQLDGRPMSGDLGAMTARAAVQLLADLHRQLPPGPLQLAGGTNARSLPVLTSQSRAVQAAAAGVGFGGEARRRLQPWLLEAQQRGSRLLDCADLWPAALAAADALVRPWLQRRAGFGSAVDEAPAAMGN